MDEEGVFCSTTNVRPPQKTCKMKDVTTEEIYLSVSTILLLLLLLRFLSLSEGGINCWSVI